MKTNLETEVRECLAKGMSYPSTAKLLRKNGFTSSRGLPITTVHVAYVANKLKLNKQTDRRIEIKQPTLEQKIVRSTRLSNDTKVAVLTELLG